MRPARPKVAMFGDIYERGPDHDPETTRCTACGIHIQVVAFHTADGGCYCTSCWLTGPVAQLAAQQTGATTEPERVADAAAEIPFWVATGERP